MANIKSAKKRILVNETKAARNKAIRSKVKTACKKVDAAVTAGDKAAAQVVLNAAISEIEKATVRVFTIRTQLPERFLVFLKLSTLWLKSYAGRSI